METDHDGLIPESLEFILRTQDVKFVYLIPTFQNPTGRTIPLERRKQIAKIIQTYGALLVEDDPYSALRYRGESIPPIKVYAPDHVVYTGTFSKVFAPGLRVGFFVAPSVITQWMVLAKQGIDLHTSTFNQALAAEYLEGGFLDRQIPRIIALYRPKMDAMLSALQEYFPDGFTWSKPEGGMFVWVEGPETFNMEKVYPKAIQRKTAFVPGKYFYTSKGNGLETMRLNFTMSDADRIDQAIKILSEVIQETLEH